MPKVIDSVSANLSALPNAQSQKVTRADSYQKKRC